MNTYLYPQNLKAHATLWLWSLRDFAILIIAALAAVFALIHTLFIPPLAAVVVYGFLTIRLDDSTILDFIKHAVRFFITTQQIFEWRFNIL